MTRIQPAEEGRRDTKGYEFGKVTPRPRKTYT
jgi:hypothetical protein